MGGCRVGGAGVCCVAVGVLVWVKIQVGTQEHTAGGCFVSDFLKNSCKKFFLGRKVGRRRNVYALTGVLILLLCISHLHIKTPTEPPQQHTQTIQRAKQNPGGVYTSGACPVLLFICRYCQRLHNTIFQQGRRLVVMRGGFQQVPFRYPG